MSGNYKTNLDPGLAFDIRWPMAADDDTTQFEGWDQLPMPSHHQCQARLALVAEGGSGTATMPTMLADSQSMLVDGGRYKQY